MVYCAHWSGGGVVEQLPALQVQLKPEHEPSVAPNELPDLQRSSASHQPQPGCAVQQAIADGRLAEERLKSYQKLRQEADAELRSHA